MHITVCPSAFDVKIYSQDSDAIPLSLQHSSTKLLFSRLVIGIWAVIIDLFLILDTFLRTQETLVVLTCLVGYAA